MATRWRMATGGGVNDLGLDEGECVWCGSTRFGSTTVRRGSKPDSTVAKPETKQPISFWGGGVCWPGFGSFGGLLFHFIIV
jgi:hypothetical protein